MAYADRKKEEARRETVDAVIEYLQSIGYYTAAQKVTDKFKSNGRK